MGRLAILSVAYPFAAAGPDAVGGAEQVLSTLDTALVHAGHRSIVIAAEGSQAAGTLVPIETMGAACLIDDTVRAAVHARVRMAITHVLAHEKIDLVHLHGIDFAAYLPPSGPPVLATLHLPTDWYPADALRPSRPRTWLHCVSALQNRMCGGERHMLPPIPNGVDVEGLASARHARRSFLLALGRICPEKGQHFALEAARRANVPLLLGGAVFPYSGHLDYFANWVRPLLDEARRFLGPVGFARKRRLLAAARAVLIPSLAPETSSLVAMEAAAAGTPVIAFRNGALPDTVAHGVTGFVVDGPNEMAEAIGRVDAIDREACRALARRRFRREDMIGRYFAVYRDLAAP